MKQYSNAYLALMGKSPGRVPSYEHLSNPDFVKLVTGIDPWERPRSAMLEFYRVMDIDFLFKGIPEDDTPIRKYEESESSVEDEEGHHRVRWGTSYTNHWDWGTGFKTVEDVLAYDPLEHLDMRNIEVIEKRDYSLDDDAFFEAYYANPPLSEEDPEHKNSDIVTVSAGGFYNTLFMWPMLTFGWELFLELIGCYPDEAKRIIDGFATISRKVFKSLARTPDHVNMMVCHDDICMTKGPVCSPNWLRGYIYPHYEEFFSILKAGGKRVVFVSDGNIDKVADDLAACGADGFVSEPYTDWKVLAARYPNHVLAGEGDNRILMDGDASEIRRMVDSMVETAKMCGGYMMCVGNHIPWNVPPENVQTYFNHCRENAVRSYLLSR